MELTWKVFIPLSLANVVIVMTVLQFDWNLSWLPLLSLCLYLVYVVVAALAKRYDIRHRRRASLAST
jgi:hypothetical protein